MRPEENKKLNDAVNKLLVAILGDLDNDDEGQEKIRRIGVESALFKVTRGDELTADDFLGLAQADVDLFLATINDLSGLYSPETMTESLKEILQAKSGHRLYKEIIGSLLKRLSDEGLSVSYQEPVQQLAEVKDNSPEHKSYLNQWLVKTLKEVTTELNELAGGQICLAQGAHSNRLKVEVHSDSLALKYSVFSSLLPSQPDQGLVVFQDPKVNPLVFEVDRTQLESAKQAHDDIVFVRSWLTQNGYHIKVGQKLCSSVFNENQSAINRDGMGVERQFGVSLAVVDAMSVDLDMMIIPFAAQVSTYSDELMHQLELYYRELEFRARNGQPKTFITETRAPGKNHKSNLAADQAKAMRSHFERLDVAAKYLGVRCAELGGEQQVKQFFEGQRAKQFDLIVSALEKWLPDASAYPHLLPQYPSKNSGFDLFGILKLFEKDKSMSASTSVVYSEAKFEELLEKHLNQHVVLGPNAFRLLANDHTLGMSQAIGGAVDSERAGCDGKSSFQLVKAGRVNSPYNSSSMALYFVAVDDVKRFSYLSPLTNRLREVRQFLSIHTPYYMVKNAVSNIAAILADSNTSTQVVKNIIESLGADPEHYRVSCSDDYNRYQIQFDLIPMVMACFMKHDVLMTGSKLEAASHPWAFNPQTKRYQSHTPQAWQTAIEWRMNDVHKCRWTAGRSQYQQQMSYSQRHGSSTGLAGVFGQRRGSSSIEIGDKKREVEPASYS